MIKKINNQSSLLIGSPQRPISPQNILFMTHMNTVCKYALQKALRRINNAVLIFLSTCPGSICPDTRLTSFFVCFFFLLGDNILSPHGYQTWYFLCVQCASHLGLHFSPLDGAKCHLHTRAVTFAKFNSWKVISRNGKIRCIAILSMLQFCVVVTIVFLISNILC